MILQSHQTVAALKGHKAEALGILEGGFDKIEEYLIITNADDDIWDRAFNITLQFIRNRSKSNMGWCKYNWDSKCHKTAKCQSSTITINWGHKVFAREPEQIRDTILHEVAHHLAVVLHGPAGANHGPLWKHCAEIVGANPTATHKSEPKSIVQVYPREQ